MNRSIFLVASTCVLHLVQYHCSSPDMYSSSQNKSKQSSSELHFSEMGSDRYMNGSNFTLTCEHCVHVMVLRNCPWNRSTTID